jgi:hypothetical protein
MSAGMGLKARIKWHYRPTDYFEEPYQSEFDGIALKINAGEIIAEIDIKRYEQNPGIRQSLMGHIKGLFEGVMLLSHMGFDISEGAVEKDRPGGGKEIELSAHLSAYVMASDNVDIQIKDAQGTVIADTRQDRVAAKRTLAELVASKRGSDQTLDAMLKSYANAVRDPADELIHLYEIRDALKDRFGDEASARNAVGIIGISGTKWKTLGRLANNEPLKQGRHRGKKSSELRDATPQELEEARSIAREMIVLYARQLP